MSSSSPVTRPVLSESTAPEDTPPMSGAPIAALLEKAFELADAVGSGRDRRVGGGAAPFDDAVAGAGPVVPHGPDAQHIGVLRQQGHDLVDMTEGGDEIHEPEGGAAVPVFGAQGLVIDGEGVFGLWRQPRPGDRRARVAAGAEQFVLAQAQGRFE